MLILVVLSMRLLDTGFASGMFPHFLYPCPLPLCIFFTTIPFILPPSRHIFLSCL